jgi:large subunit ribosomal protein L5
MYMTYIHEAGPRPEPRKIRLTYDPSNPYAHFRHNPPVGGSQLGKKLPPPDTPQNVVRLEKIVLHSFQKTAIGSRASLLGLIMALQTLSGETERAMGRHNVTGVQLVHRKKSVGGWIRPGVPVGAKVELQGAPMYDFLGQLVEFVLPRLKDFPGILLPPPGTSSHSPSAVSGVVSIGLTPQAMQYFPQIEVNVNAYPKMYGPSILVKRVLRVCVEFVYSCLFIAGRFLESDGTAEDGALYRGEGPCVDAVDSRDDWSAVLASGSGGASDSFDVDKGKG